MRSRNLTELDKKIGTAIEGATPGLQIAAYHKDKKIYEHQFGKTYKYYDWASLTKIVFSTCYLMHLVDKNRLQIDHPVKRYLTWFPYANIRVRELLNHSAGFRWTASYYSSLDMNLSFSGRWQQMQLLLRQEECQQPLKEAVYSDLDFLFIGAMLEQIEQRPLFHIWEDFKELLGIPQVHFCRGNLPVHARELYAPTEQCPWRKKILQGEVHDDNTWAVGGVSSHAGLFGTLKDLETWAQGLRHAYLGGRDAWVSREVARQFLRRSPLDVKGDWGLGFMMPTAQTSSSGKYFSPQSSFGHTGFTGTSFWWDVSRDVMILILSNRVHPTRENKTFVQLRPQIHNWVREALDLV